MAFAFRGISARPDKNAFAPAAELGGRVPRAGRYPYNYERNDPRASPDTQPATGLLAAMDRLPPGASMSLRRIRKLSLWSSLSESKNKLYYHIPECCDPEWKYKVDLNIEYEGPPFNAATVSMNTFGIKHPLAKRVYGAAWHNSWDSDPDIREHYWEPWRLLHGTGLVDFPLMTWFAWLNEWAEDNSLPFAALLIRLKIDRFCERLASRAVGLLVVGCLLLQLSQAQAPAGATEDDPEPRPLRPPRAPGVDAPGLFAPRC